MGEILKLKVYSKRNKKSGRRGKGEGYEFQRRKRDSFWRGKKGGGGMNFDLRNDFKDLY